MMWLFSHIRQRLLEHEEDFRRIHVQFHHFLIKSECMESLVSYRHSKRGVPNCLCDYFEFLNLVIKIHTIYNWFKIYNFSGRFFGYNSETCGRLTLQRSCSVSKLQTVTDLCKINRQNDLSNSEELYSKNHPEKWRFWASGGKK